MRYLINFHDVGADTVRRGVSTPYEQNSTGSFENAHKTAIEYTTEDQNCSVVIVSMSTGNRLYFQDGKEVK